MLESRGILADTIDELDKHSSQWRRIYFLRRAVLTLREIDDAVDDLYWKTEFRNLLSKQSKSEQDEFADTRIKLKDARTVVKVLRDKLSGHILPNEVQKGLERFDPGTFGLLEAGPTLERTHYKFAGEIVAAIISADVADFQKQRQKLESDFEKIGQVVSVVGMLDKIIIWYAEDRHLI